MLAISTVRRTPKPDSPAENMPITAAVIREFMIEILGSLVPGFLFTMVAVPLIVWTGVVIANSNPTYTTSLLQEVVIFRVELIPLLLVVSYVLGSVFSRRDPKVSDEESVAYILQRDWGSRYRATVQPRTQEDKDEQARLESRRTSSTLFSRFQSYLEIRRFCHKLARGEGAQFPYSHLCESLEARGLHHLAKHVPWQGDGGTIEKRSKMFINILKIRLQRWNLRQCGEIVRIEAHIRMMSSLWHAARLLQQVSLVLLVVAAVMCKWEGSSPGKIALVVLTLFLAVPWLRRGTVATVILLTVAALWCRWGDPSLGEIALVVLTVFLALEWLRRAITAFLHYQRVREIVFVLESAHVAWREGCNYIFEGF